jgi:ubiquitin carboxyl-terminal hydrolase 9/24
LASFPVQKLISLHTKISSPRWVVPVLPEQELECLLNAAIKLSQNGLDQESEPCMRFYKESLTQSFLKILTDDAVNSWKYNIHHCILMSCGKLLHLCALHMKHDNSYLLDLLAIVFDPENKFHTHNAQRQPELFNITSTASSGSSATTLTATNTVTSWGVLNENQIFARSPPDPRNPRGWLVDLINRFGQHGGFENLLERFNIGIALIHNNKKRLSATTNESGVDLQHQQTASTSSLSLSGDDLSSTRMKTSTISSNGGTTNSTTSSSMLLSTSDDTSLATNKLTLPIIYLLIRPFGQCYELLTEQTIEKYFMNIWEIILELLENLSDDELKREAKLEGKNDTINGIVKAARCLISRIPNQENLVKDFEMCRLKIILRVLQTSSFNGKMNALNEINKVLGYVSYYPHRSQTSPDDDVDYLTADKMAVSIYTYIVLYKM